MVWGYVMVRGVYFCLIIFFSLFIKIYLIGVFEVWYFNYFYEKDIKEYFVVFYFSVICNIVYILKVFVGFFFIYFLDIEYLVEGFFLYVKLIMNVLC